MIAESIGGLICNKDSMCEGVCERVSEKVCSKSHERVGDRAYEKMSEMV